jgi:hypothetical protein
MNTLHTIRCYRNGTVVRSEICTSLWEADTKVKEMIESKQYDEIKIFSQGDDDAKLV